jgi:hypothetical protein
MKNYLLPLLFVTPLCVMAAIAFCIWHAYQLHKRIRGTAPSKSIASCEKCGSVS